MITKDEYIVAQTQSALHDTQKVIKAIEDNLRYNRLVTEMKSSSITTPWYILIPHIEKHVEKYGWKLSVRDTFKTEGQWDTYKVMYKEFTLS